MVNWFQLLPWLTVIAIDASVATATANRSWTTPSPPGQLLDIQHAKLSLLSQEDLKKE